MFSDLDRKLCQALCDHPRRHKYRYTPLAREDLLQILFTSLTNDRPHSLEALFPEGIPESYKLQDAQGKQTLAEYTEAARGLPCGHIFQHGEASYHCMTCADDATSVLCARCFDSSDHEGHQFHISPSAGNSGCCDCGDDEAWKKTVNCAIHTATDHDVNNPEISTLPEDLQKSIRTTISRVLDYFCDVISCSPENLRVPKTEETIRHDENYSRLGEKYSVNGDDADPDPEYCLVLWNDEKHTMAEVKSQVARACRKRESFGAEKASEAHHIGRSVVRHSRDLEQLIHQAKIIEQIKLTVTIRSSRDTFREQMCGTIVQWLSDIAGCSMLGDYRILRRVICEEMLQQWRVGSEAYHAKVGRSGIDTHGNTEALKLHRLPQATAQLGAWHDIPGVIAGLQAGILFPEDVDGDEDDDDEGADEVPDPYTEEQDDQDDEMADGDPEDAVDLAQDMQDAAERGEVDSDGDAEFIDVNEYLHNEGQDDARQPGQTSQHQARTGNVDSVMSPIESDTGDAVFVSDDQSKNFQHIPKTPNQNPKKRGQPPPNHWSIVPPGYSINRKDVPPHEDFSRNIRLDSLVLFDLRLWKLTRVELRDLYISTVVNIPEFKRILGLRFSGLYTTLSQLYLVADREPDHSIMNLSLQMLTTPSITKEVIERGNFLTNLMAILYTFLTTRQVGYPKDVDPQATLAFETGSVTNRRLLHFFTDLRWYLASTFVQDKVRNEEQYLSQYLDLAKLAQGICPNLRAIGEHVEYETDAWINASVLTREINKLCRQFAEAFHVTDGKQRAATSQLKKAILQTACAVILNSLGLERKRFEQNEIKNEVTFKLIEPYEPDGSGLYKVVNFVVANEPMSFHHPLHYILSWLLEFANGSSEGLLALFEAAKKITYSLQDVVPPSHRILDSWEDSLIAMYDYPIRVCAWLAQMKAGLWVRNGLSLRHQMYQYISVSYRDVGHHRDLILVQTALVTCDPARILASIIDRYGLDGWMRGGTDLGYLKDYEESQVLEIVEDLISLLITLLSDRDALITLEQDPHPQINAIRKSVTHTLCFKPLTFSDLTARLTERIQDQEQFQEVLNQLTTFKPPEGLHDSGLFELRPEYLSEIDPYNPHFSKNQRDEAETLYKNYMSKQTGKPADEIVLEPSLRPIQDGAYRRLMDVTREPLFAHVILMCLCYVQWPRPEHNPVPFTRLESFLHVVLQLALIATVEDPVNSGNTLAGQAARKSFVCNMLNLGTKIPDGRPYPTSIPVLHKICKMDQFASCRPKIRHLLKHFVRHDDSGFQKAKGNLEFPFGRLDTASPANVGDVDAKKQQATERKAKVMAQFQQQQQSFIDQQGMLDWGDVDDLEDSGESPGISETRVWKAPSGVCIHCREETNDTKLYGTFAMLIDGHTLRQTDLHSSEFIRETFNVPQSLDRKLERTRPFGVSGENHETVRRLTSSGNKLEIDRQGLGQGWPAQHTLPGLVSTGCGHIMHFSCFETYYASVSRRQSSQIARNHPERLSQREFVCPLCKALGNAFLPIVHRSVEQSYPAGLRTDIPLDLWLENELPQLEHLETSARAETKVPERNHSRSGSTTSDSAYPSNGPWGESTRSNRASDVSPSDSVGGSTPDYLNAFPRLSTTLHVAKGKDFRRHNADPATTLRLLLDTFADSISAAEIACRGQSSDPLATLISSVSQQTLSHLQILASTAEVFCGSQSWAKAPENEPMIYDVKRQLFTELFPQAIRTADAMPSESDARPLIRTDPFQQLTAASIVFSKDETIPLSHLLRICYTAEVLRVIAAYVVHFASPWFQDPARYAHHEQLLYSFGRSSHVEQTRDWIEQVFSRNVDLGEENGLYDHETLWPIRHKDFMPQTSGALHRVLRAHALTFLRRAAILMHVAHRVDFPTIEVEESTLPELDRLRRHLLMPSLEEVMQDLTALGPHPAIARLAERWIIHFTESEKPYSRGPPDGFHQFKIDLLHPAPLELIGLPKYYDVLMEESHRRRCPTTGEEITDPALCLFCGAIFCAQASCCTQGARGGCNVHIDRCSYPIGLFLIIRKCTIVMLHVAPAPRLTGSGEWTNTLIEPQTLSNGSFFPAPYLTKHGETDSGLRTRYQLILNQHRYDKLLRDVWLMVNPSSTIWSAIARKLEGDVNAGGWGTL